MAKGNIIWDLIARDRASATFNKVGKSTDGLKGKFKEFGGGFKDAFSPSSIASVGAAGAAVAAFGISSVQAFADAEAAQAKLTNAFNKFPQLADSNAAALRRLNEELAKKTVFDDDATASAQAVLASFGLTEQQLRTLTPLVQDFAARTGKDLSTAATDVGKALDGQGRSLKAVGLDLDLTGTRAENYGLVLDGLRAKVGGFAEKEGETFNGKMTILRNRFGELQEKIGKQLLPTLVSFADWLNDTGIPTAEKMAEKFGKWADRLHDAFVWADKLARKLPHIPGIGKGGGIGEGLKGGIISAVPGLALLGFDSGGVVPGPIGAPMPALVHGGETILPTHKQPFAGASLSVTNHNYWPHSEQATTNQSLRDAAFLMGVA